VSSRLRFFRAWKHSDSAGRAAQKNPDEKLSRSGREDDMSRGHFERQTEITEPAIAAGSIIFVVAPNF
jgi:hypothetical protein